MYDFNIVQGETITGFSINKHGEIYTYRKGYGFTYLLTDDEARNIVNAGGLDKIKEFLKSTNYKDQMSVNDCTVINLTV